MCQEDKAWFAVQVRPRHEITTASHLHTKGLEIFVPMYSSRRQWADRQVNVILPLFTGYVFSRFSARTALPVVTTPGVVRIVGSKKSPSPIADHEIVSIKRAVQQLENIRPYPYLAVGSRVRIEAGPFAGLEGILIRHKNGSQLILSLDLVQRSIALEIDSCAISLLDKAV